MLENMLQEYLKVGLQEGKRYIVEETADGKIVFLACLPECQRIHVYEILESAIFVYHSGIGRDGMERAE